MFKIALYISDVGWGHATRQIELVKSLCSKTDEVVFYIKNTIAADLIYTELENLIKKGRVVIYASDYVFEPGWPREYPFDEELFKHNLETWLDSWKFNVENEVEFLKALKPDLVVSDIVACAFEAAHICSIKSVAICSINWWDEYTYIAGYFKGHNFLHEAYSKADCAVILPFSSRNSVFRKIVRKPLLVRSIDSLKVKRLRSMFLKKYKPQLVLTTTLGGFYRHNRLVESVMKTVEVISRRLDVLIVVPEFIAEGFEGFEKVFVVDKNSADFNNYIAASDLVVSKLGYGVLSEAVANRIPAVLFYRPNVLEDRLLSSNLTSYSNLCFLRYDEEFDIEWLPRIFDDVLYNVDLNGADEIASFIMERYI